MISKFIPYRDEIINKTRSDAEIANDIGCTRSAIRSFRNRCLNPEKNNNYKKMWRKENPEKFRAQCERYQKKSSVATKSWRKEKALSSSQNISNALPSTNIPREIDWMQWENDLILNSGKSHKELSEYLELPTAKIKRQELYLLDEERRMQKKVEIPLRCGIIEDSDDLDREIQRAKNLISRFKKDLDWKNDRGLQELIVSPKKNLYHFLKEIEKKFNDMEKWNDKDSKNRNLLIIPYFENIYKIIEMSYESRQWQVLYIKK